MALERHAPDPALAAWLDGLLAPAPPLQDLYAEMAEDEWAEMMTHPDLGRLLAVLVRATGGRRVLEVGTFVGTSAAWMAPALAAGGTIDTLEADPARAARAAAFLERAGLAGRVQVHTGPALETLPGLPDGAYDLCYLDADKTGYPAYLDHALRLVRPGGLIVADNVFGGGALGRPREQDDARAAALRGYTERAMADPRLLTTILTVGDGVAVSAVR
jgi:predicted O-methyltransferase YrrM